MKSSKPMKHIDGAHPLIAEKIMRLWGSTECERYIRCLLDYNLYTQRKFSQLMLLSLRDVLKMPYQPVNIPSNPTQL